MRQRGWTAYIWLVSRAIVSDGMLMAVSAVMVSEVAGASSVLCSPPHAAAKTTSAANQIRFVMRLLLTKL